MPTSTALITATVTAIPPSRARPQARKEAPNRFVLVGHNGLISIVLLKCIGS
jgi:hypothetical protein